MALVPLPVTVGLNSDDTSFSTKGRWSGGSNIRPYNDRMQVVGPSAAVTAFTFTVDQALGGIGAFQSGAGGIYAVYATSTMLWGGSGLGGPADVTPVGWSVPGSGFSMEAWGNTVLVSPANGKLFQWTMGGGAAAEIANAPDQIRTVLVSPQRQVIALGCNEEVSATFNGRCIRGSDLEDATDWTTASANNAFEHIIDDTGTIVTGRYVGNDLMILTSTSLWMGEFVGDPGQTYAFRLVQTGCGIVSSCDAACVKDGVLYWLANDLRVWAFAPGAPAQPVPCPISKDFHDNIENADAAVVFAIPHFGEVAVLYADSRDGSSSEPTRYIAFNGKGEWYRGTMARTAVCSNMLASELVQAADQNAAGGYLAVRDNVVYYHELSTGSVTWSLQSADQYIDNSQRRMMIRGIVQDFEDQGGDVSLTLYCRDRPQSTPVTKGPYTLTAASSKKDFRVSGKIVSAKFSGTASMRMGQLLFDTVATGER